jgi:hypothetical protein
LATSSITLWAHNTKTVRKDQVMDTRDKVQETLYLYHLIGRLATLVRSGRGSHEYRLATQLLHANDAWQHLTDHKLRESVRNVKDESYWTPLVALARQLDATVKGVTRLKPVPGPRDVHLLKSDRGVRLLAQLTGRSESTVLDEVFDVEVLWMIAQSLHVYVDKRTPTTILGAMLDDTDRLGALHQTGVTIYETLADSLLETVREHLASKLAVTESVVIQEIVGRLLPSPDLSDHSTDARTDQFTVGQIRNVLNVVHQAVQTDALNSTRELARLFPGDGNVARLGLVCELELALDYKRAVALLVPDLMPVRALIPKSEPQDAANVTANTGQIQVVRRQVSLLERLRGGRQPAIWDIMLLDAAQPPRTILTVKDVDEAVMNHLKESMTADVANLPREGQPLHKRVLEYCIVPPPTFAPYLAACRAVADDFAVLFELIAVRGLEQSLDVEEALRQGSFQLQLDADPEGLSVGMSLDDFFRQFTD